MENYFKRIIDNILKRNLKIFGALNLVGPKWCGKSCSANRVCRSALKVDEYSKDVITFSINNHPKQYLLTEKPQLVDEWQEAPKLWDAVRNICDEIGKPGNFILTGSTANHPKTSHTGTGRISTINMYPMSLYESKESNGTISLMDLFNQNFTLSKTSLTNEQLVFAACRGGWPWSLLVESDDDKLKVAKSYFLDIYNKDIEKYDEFKASSSIMNKILKSYARNISTLASDATIYNDCNINYRTLDNYLELLKKLYIVEELEPWMISLRSKSCVRQSNKREFVDPSIAVAALNATPAKLLKDPKTFGLIFETLCIRDLRVYSTAFGGHLSYYRDQTGLECDCILELDDGRYALIEIKYGQNGILEGVNNLNKIEEFIHKYNQNKKNINKISLPSFKMVITSLQESTIADGGIFIVPIGCLKD